MLMNWVGALRERFWDWQMNGGAVAEIGNLGVRVGVRSSGLGMISNSQYLLAIQEEMVSQLQETGV